MEDQYWWNSTPISMKLSLLTIAALVAVATADSTFYRKQADSVFLDKQQKVLKLLVGLGADWKTYQAHEHVPFPYNKPEFYKKPEVLESFMKVYERGLLDRQGVFTLFCHKNRHDTFKVFDLFYYAKDFNTFFDIATWARDELNPMQFSYAFTTAVFHREDTRGIYIPPLYEILPRYFVQNEVMHQAIAAKSQGETYGKFDVNNTGWEWSWHADMLTGPYKASSKWVGDDFESRVSYFREDVGLANFLTYFNMKFAAWLSTAKYPDIHYYRRGEIFYSVFKWIKNRYNLERMVSGLTPVIPFETYEKLPGYNPHLQDNFGRNYLVRQDKLVAEEENQEGTWELNQVLSRLSDVVDSTVIWDVETPGKVHKLVGEGVNTLDEFSKIIFGARDAKSSQYYKLPYYYYLQTINEMVKAPNDRDYTNTVMGTTMTQPRDPAFYMVLAKLDQWFEKLFHTLPFYTKEELGFPGVSIEKFELDRLDTYFERYDWELTNGINFAQRYSRLEKKFEASQFRINHKPYTYKVYVKSDKEADVFVRVFLAPKTDVDGREFSFDQQRKAMINLDVFKAKVKPGENIFERHSHQNAYFEEYQRFRPFYEKVNKSLESKEPFYYNEQWQCRAPQNLMIPKGWKSGKEFTIFTIVTKYEPQPEFEGYYPCHHNMAFDQHSVDFPTDRAIYNEDYSLPNMFFSSVKIYHARHESLNRQNH